MQRLNFYNGLCDNIKMQLEHTRKKREINIKAVLCYEMACDITADWLKLKEMIKQYIRSMERKDEKKDIILL